MKIFSLLSFPQWLKNLLIFIPAIFGRAEWNQELILGLLLGFIGFSLLASAVYLQNDMADQKTDALHPQKCKRPIASGALSIRQASVFAILFFTCGSGFLLMLSLNALLVGLIYVALNLLYTWFVKSIAIIDVLWLIQGYWLRLILGSLVSGLVLSYWVLGVVAFLAAYFILSKRLGDVEMYLTKDVITRRSVEFYSKLPIRSILHVLVIVIGLAFLAYIIFVFQYAGFYFSPWIYVSVPLVWFALMRFHFRMMRNPMIDPLVLSFRDFWTVLPGLAAFLILCLSLYLR